MDEVIYEHLIEQPDLMDILTSYDERPAVFNREAPAAEDEEWADGAQYPRIIFGLDMQEDPERKISGTLTLDVYFSTEVFLEDIEPMVRRTLDQKFFSDTDNTIAVNWRSNNPFVTPESGDQIAGVTMVFDVVALPGQHLTFPCPVTALDEFVKEIFPKFTVIGMDRLPHVFEATDSIPVLYVRLRELKSSTRPNTYFTQWYDATMVVHVIAPDITAREKVAKILIEALGRRRERIKMPDGSPMMISQVVEQMGADQLKTGQITMTGTYGLLTKFSGTPLKSIKISERF